MATPKRVTRSKSNDGDVAALLMRMKDEIIQATQQEIRKEIRTVIEKLSCLENRIESLELSLSRVSSRQEQQEECITDLANQVNELKMKSSSSDEIFDELHERLKRSKNLIISGVPEHETGSVEERREKDEIYVRTILETLKCDPGCYKNISRIGKIRNDGSRLIRVTVFTAELASQILQTAKLLRRYGEYRKVYINPDRTMAQQKHFSMLHRELKARRDGGEDVVIFRGRVANKDALRDSSKNFQ